MTHFIQQYNVSVQMQYNNCLLREMGEKRKKREKIDSNQKMKKRRRKKRETKKQ